MRDDTLYYFVFKVCKCIIRWRFSEEKLDVFLAF